MFERTDKPLVIIIHHIRVNFITEYQNPSILDKLSQGVKIFSLEKLGTRISRRVDDNQLRFSRSHSAYRLPIDLKSGRIGRNIPYHATKKPHSRCIRIISWFEDDGLITGVD